uniref:Phosphatase and actin regulator 3b n=1 Tax=Lates calcarifer TaxID=8187 RepID=A0A4W6EGD3_LATCA
MASSDGLDEDCMLQRGRSQSDPSSITEVRLDGMDQQRALHSGCLVSGVRTPPVRRNSKLASLGRIFKPWKWRKKKNEKLKPSASECDSSVRQKRDDLVKRNPGEMETESDLACGGNSEDPDTPTHSDGEDRDEEPVAPLASTNEDLGSDLEASTVRYFPQEVTDGEDESTSLSDPGEEQSMGKVETVEGKQEVTVTQPQRRASTPPPPNMPVKLLTRLVKKSPATLPRNFTLPKDPHGSLLRGRISTPTGSPTLGHYTHSCPPAVSLRKLHRALATKHRQDSFQTKEARSSPKRRLDGRLSRTSSTEREPAGESESKKDDQDSWNESVISGRSLLTADMYWNICFTIICLLMYKASKIWATCQWIMKQHNLLIFVYSERHDREICSNDE